MASSAEFGAFRGVPDQYQKLYTFSELYISDSSLTLFEQLFLYNSEGEWGSIGLLRNHWFLMEEGVGVGDGIG